MSNTIPIAAMTLVTLLAVVVMLWSQPTQPAPTDCRWRESPTYLAAR